MLWSVEKESVHANTEMDQSRRKIACEAMKWRNEDKKNIKSQWGRTRMIGICGCTCWNERRYLGKIIDIQRKEMGRNGKKDQFSVISFPRSEKRLKMEKNVKARCREEIWYIEQPVSPNYITYCPACPSGDIRAPSDLPKICYVSMFLTTDNPNM